MILSQVFRYSRGHLKIRFRKLNHNIMLPMNEPVHRMEIDENGDINSEQMNRIRTIRYFGESPPVAAPQFRAQLTNIFCAQRTYPGTAASF